MGTVGGGWTLTDKSKTVYTFDAPGRLTGITDVNGLSEDLSYDAGVLTTVTNTTSARSLHLSWSGGHIHTIATDPVDGSPLTWTYDYEGDELTSVCSPVSATKCTTYSYDSGSHYRTEVLDGTPHAYWRLSDPSGSTDAVDEVDINQGSLDAGYTSVGLGTDGALAGSSATSASFDGSSSVMTLPKSVVEDAGSYLAVEMWFKTSGTGPLLEYQSKPQGSSTTPSFYRPELYVGADGKLRGEFADNHVQPITTAQAVNDGSWHYAALTGEGSLQTLYLDGAKVGTLDVEPIKHTSQPYTYLGAG